MADSATATASTAESNVRVAPALSATSDAPVTPAAAAPEPKAEDTTKVAPAEGETGGENTEVTETETGEGESEPAKTAKPKEELPAYAKREITKARNQKREADTARVAMEARANEAQANLKKALDLVEKLTGESAVVARKTSEAEDPRPKRETFDNPDAYDTALVEWAGRVAAQAATAKSEALAEESRTKEKNETEQREIQARNKETVEAFAKRKDAFAEDHPDYADVAESDDLQISIPMAQVIMQDEDGPAIAYYLGQNPDEAERISKLSPPKAASELGRIAARLNAKPAVSTKPAPIKPLKSGDAPASARKSPNDMTMEEYAAHRKSSLNGAGPPH